MKRAAILCALAALAIAIGWRIGRPEATPPSPTEAVGSAPVAAPREFVASTIVQREPVATPAARNRTFEEYVDLLVELGARTWNALEDDDQALAEELDAETRDELAAMRRELENTDEKSLHALCGLLSEDGTQRGRIRRRVLCTILGLGLRARWQRFEYGGSRAASDRLVSSILASLDQDEVLAQDLGRMLADEPFLGAAHEGAVLGLVERAADEPFLADVAEALLRTLWRNLERDGSRTSAELASLALLFADDTNTSRRLSALHHLLTAEGGRYESWVVDLVVREGDAAIAGELAMTAGAELPPERALRVLERLAAVDGVQTTGAFLMLGQRAPNALREAYEQRVADGIAPHVRAELVTGAGFRGDAVDVAQLAFDHDPDPEVRTRALLVLSAQAVPEVAERTLLEALDDPRFADRPDRIGTVVSALANLAQAGEVNAVDRVGRRLLVHPLLAEGDRTRLEQLLARYTPR